MTCMITVAGQKGGAGKTTIAINLAEELCSRGHRVLLVDADLQCSARHWADVAAEEGREVSPVLGVSGPSMRASIAAVAGSFDIIVIDTPPRLGVEAKTGIAIADLVLVPVSPGPTDLWALGEVQKVIEEGRVFHPQLIAAIVLNRVDARTMLSSSMKEAAAESQIPVLSTTLGNRVAYPEALAAGAGVNSYAPGTPAAKETASLASEVWAALEERAAA